MPLDRQTLHVTSQLRSGIWQVLHMYVCVYVCCMCFNVCVCMCMYIFVCVYVCMYVCVCVCVCVWTANTLSKLQLFRATQCLTYAQDICERIKVLINVVLRMPSVSFLDTKGLCGEEIFPDRLVPN